MFFRALEGKGAGVVADYDADAGVESVVFGGVDDGLEIGAGVGGEDTEVEGRRHESTGGRVRGTFEPWRWRGPCGEASGCVG